MEKKIMYYAYISYGQVFWDEDKNPITCIHENDAEYLSEYMKSLFDYFGIKVEEVKKIPSNVKKYASENGCD